MILGIGETDLCDLGSSCHQKVTFFDFNVFNYKSGSALAGGSL